MLFIPGSRLGRTVLILAVLWAAGIFSVPVQAQVNIPAPPVKAVHPHESAISRLRLLIEAGENSAEADDWDSASKRIDEADVLIADWPPEVLRRPDVLPLVDRLRALERQFEEEGGEDELKMIEEVIALSPAELKAERDQVLTAEQGAVFDFPIDLNDKVLTWVNIFSGRIKARLEASLSRGSSYLPMIRQVFAEEGIPQDLAFLPIVESGYVNSARSSAKAVGMWQFMRATGKMYGLTANSWIEERRDPVKATRAAARYLKYLYEREGDWYLALVGYNAGPGTTDRASQNLGTRNYWDMVRSKWLRNATKSYVPQMCAAVLIGRFPERYGLNITQGTPYAYETVDVNRMTSLSVLAKYAATDVETLKVLNPELLRASTPPGSYALRVPPGSARGAARALAGAPSREHLDFKPYVIRKGDSLARVAGKFKVSPEEILLANGIKPSQFKVGVRIKLPLPGAIPIERADLKSASVGSKIRPDRPLEPLPIVPGSPNIATEASANKDPAKSPTSAADPEVGQPVTDLPAIPNAVTTPVLLTGAKVPSKRITDEASKARTHRVKKGETLFSICQRYDVELADLRKWNGIKGNKIQVGQNLRLQSR